MPSHSHLATSVETGPSFSVHYSLSHPTLFPPVRPSAGIIPALEMIPVIEGQELGLDCETGGNPPPRVTWAKEGALLPSGDNLIEGAKLYFPRLVREG